jgi:hypothetical protein
MSILGSRGQWRPTLTDETFRAANITIEALTGDVRRDAEQLAAQLISEGDGKRVVKSWSRRRGIILSLAQRQITDDFATVMLNLGYLPLLSLVNPNDVIESRPAPVVA